MAPQSLRINIASEAGCQEFQELLSELAPGTIELAGLDQFPAPVRDLLVRQGYAYDILLIDTRFAAFSDTGWKVLSKWQSPIDSAASIIAADEQAMLFASQLGLEAKPARTASRRAPHPAKRPSDATCLGIVAMEGSVQEFRFLKEFCLHLLTKRLDFDVVVIGATIDDLALMRMPQVHVTGLVAESEIDTILNAYTIDRLMLGVGRALFGHPLTLATLATGLPSARFGLRPAAADGRDLWLSPNVSNAEAVELVADWFNT